MGMYTPRYSARRRRSAFGGMGWAVGIVAALVIIVGGIATVASGYYKHRTVTFQVTDRERVCSGSNGSCKYLIWTNKGVFQDTDSLLNGKFRSSDLYGELKPGKTFTCTVYGWRSGFMSWYPNIVSCKPA